MTASRLPILALLLTLACGDKDDHSHDDTGVSESDGDGGAGDGGAGDGGSGDGGSTTPTSESDCEDGIDEDEDGATDCEDSDCADHWRCNLPDALQYSTVVDFRGNTIECEWVGIEYDVDIDDCYSAGGGTLTQIDTEQACPKCDRTYKGPLNWPQDSCSDFLETPMPADATFGFVFISETQRELWVPDDVWNWYPLAILDDNAGVYGDSSSEDIIADPDDCDNGDQNLGTLTLTLQFTDL